MPGTPEARSKGETLITAGKDQLARIPDKFWLTVTWDQLTSDAEARAGAYANINVGRIFKSQQGALLYGWLRGGLPRTVVFGGGSVITQGIRDSEVVREEVDVLRAALRSGLPVPDLGYDAGKPSLTNGNFVRDVMAFALWDSAPNSARSLAVVGSFQLQAVVDERTSNSAQVTFRAVNITTLGSGLSFTEQWRDFANTLPGDSGAMSDVSQIYEWTESVEW